MRAALEDRPGLSDRQIVAAYLDLLPAHGRNDSCINHTSRGCALPREMRSTTCNRYACEALARLQHHQRSDAGVGVVMVVQRGLDNWRQSARDRDDPVTGGAVLTEQRLRRVVLAPATDDPIDPLSGARQSASP